MKVQNNEHATVIQNSCFLKRFSKISIPTKKPKKKKVIEISDDEEDVETKVEKEKKKKKAFNEKLFEQLSSKLTSEPKKSQKSSRPKNTVDPGFAAELEKIKENRVYYFNL